jgi:DNA repair exonuclease SbcCD ATPase subunit
MTKRQEALDAMSQILQSNPQLWSVAGDLFIKNMDWPGAQEMAERFKKILDPKVLAGGDKSPEMAQAEQMIEAQTQEINKMHDLLIHIQDSAEMQKVKVDEFEAEIKAYDAETKRISAVQASMSPEQIQDIVMGTVHGMMSSGELVSEMPGREAPEMPEEGMDEQMPMQEMPPEEMPMQEMPQ